MIFAGQGPAPPIAAAAGLLRPGVGVQHGGHNGDEHDVYHPNGIPAGAVSEDYDEDWIPEPGLDADLESAPAVDPAVQPAPAPADEDEEPDEPPDEEFSDDMDDDDEFFDAADDNEFQHTFQPADVNPRLHQPLYLHATHSVIQAVFALVSLKIKNNMSDEAFEDMLQLNKLLAPQPNKYPPSFHVCKSMLGVKPIKNYEWHTCGCHETAWDPKGPSSPTDACLYCGEPRFKPNKRGKLIPVQVIAVITNSVLLLTGNGVPLVWLVCT